MLTLLILLPLALTAPGPGPSGAASESTGIHVELGAPPEGAGTSAHSRAATARDTTIRLPGAPLRFGWTQERCAALGAFRRVSGTATDGTREGTCVWFGADARAVLTFRGDRLSQVRLSIDSVAAHVVDFVGDELRRQGYRRVGWSLASGTAESEWIGRAHARLAASAASLTGEFMLDPEPGPASAARAIAPLDTLDFLRTETADRLPAPVRRFTPDPPPRPSAAVEAGVFGRVLVEALVDTNGAVLDVSVLRGAEMLGAAALDWSRGVRFEPYLDRGRAVRFWIGIPVLFLPGAARSAKP